MSNTQELTTTKIQTVRQEIEAYKPLITQAMSQYLDINRVMALFFIQIQKVPKLLECSRESLFGALITATQLGLELDGATNQAHILPFGGVATLIPGYKGLETLAIRTGLVHHIVPRIVYDGDEFSYSYGANPTINHVPMHKSKKMRHVYAVANFTNGATEFLVMDKEEVEAIKKRSPSFKSGSGAWFTDEPAMWCKTSVRQVCKIIPNTSPEGAKLHKAISLDDGLDAGLPQHLELALDPNAVAAPDKPVVAEPKRESSKAQAAATEAKAPEKNDSANKNKTDRDGMKKMATRFPGKCFDCGNTITRGQEIFYNPENKKAYCVECA